MIESAAAPLGVEHGVAERAGETLEDRGLHEEAACLVVEPVQHLLDQVVGNLPLIARERANVSAGVVDLAEP